MNINERTPLKKLRKKRELLTLAKDFLRLVSDFEAVAIECNEEIKKAKFLREYIYNWLYRNSNNRAIFVTSNNDNSDALSELINNKSITFRMQKETSRYWEQTNQEDIRLIITNHHYLTRKSVFDQSHYEFLEWIDENTLVIIDDAHILYSKLQMVQPLKFRYNSHQITDNSWGKVDTWAKCPSKSTNSYRCDQCELHYYLRVESNNYRISYASTNMLNSHFEDEESWKDVYDFFESSESSLEENELYDISRNKLFGDSIICTDQDYLNERELTFYQSKQAIDSMEDLLKCSYDPLITTYDFDDDLVRAKREDLSNRYFETATLNKKVKSWQQRENLNFPVNLCNVPVLQTIDMSSLRYLINNSAKIFLFSNVFTAAQKQFFSAALPKLDWKERLAPPLKNSDELLIITTDENFDRDASLSFLKTIKDKKSKGTIIEMLMKNSDISCESKSLYVQADSNFTDYTNFLSTGNIETFSAGSFNTKNNIDSKNTLTDSKSTLVCGMDLTEYDRCIVDLKGFIPIISSDWVKSDKLLDIQQDEQIKMIMQTAARIINNSIENESKRKVLILFNTKRKFGLTLAKELKDTCKAKPKTIHLDSTWTKKQLFPPVNHAESINRILTIEKIWLRDGIANDTIIPDYDNKHHVFIKSWNSLSIKLRKRFITKDNRSISRKRLFLKSRKKV